LISTKPRYTLVAAVNNRKTLESNLLASPALQGSHDHQMIFKEGFASAATAYNSGLDEADNDIVVFLHQDIYLPAHWFDQVELAIRKLDESGSKWGVLGCFGSRQDAHGGLGRVYTNGLGMHGNAIAMPQPVETLDEIVLVLRKSSRLRFDSELPHYHMYGTDICLTARQAGLGSFAIPAFCVHNTHQILELPKEFFECYRYIKRKWSSQLPIAASCMSVTRLDHEMHRKRLSELLARLRRNRRSPIGRVENPRSLLPEELWRQLDQSDSATQKPALAIQQIADVRSAHRD
jgi:glycosyltransferase involved in cell wall biosynthesis